MIRQSGRSCPPTAVVSRASAGTVETAPPILAHSLVTELQSAVEAGFSVIAASSDPRMELPEVPLTKLTHAHFPRAVLVVGSEGEGIHSAVQALCTHRATIKGQRLPGLDSLNVGVATGILLSRLSPLHE